MLLATPPPHPSEVPNTNPNPLATAASAPIAGTKITLVNIKDGPTGLNFPSKKSGVGSLETDSRVSADTDGGSEGSGKVLGDKHGSNGAVRRKKPKNTIGKGNSTLVSRIITHDNLTKRIHDRNPDGTLMFTNINRAFIWLDWASQIKVGPAILISSAHTN